MSDSNGASASPAEREAEKDLEKQQLDNRMEGRQRARTRTQSLSQTHKATSTTFAKYVYVALNTVSTIVTVFLNKITFSDPQFRKIQITVAIWHFLTTFLVLLAASAGPYAAFKAVQLPISELLPICGLFVLFLLLNNLSLTTNPVGFYQLAKILTTPALVVLDYVLFRKTITPTRLAAVLISCVGVALTNGADSRSNPLGAVIAVAAFVVTALYQIWIGKKIKDLNVTAAQLLLNQALVSVMMLLPLVPFLDTLPNFSTTPLTIIFAFIGSGLVASMINLSQFLIIEGTSPLTFLVLGLVKTIAIVALGWWSEAKYLTIQDFAGVVMALGGAWWYSQLGASANKTL